MPPNPSEGEDQIQTVTDAWAEIDPRATIGGLTLEQLKAKVKPSLDARSTIKQLDIQGKETQIERKLADATSLAVVQNVANAVKGDENFGEDSALYAAVGYVRKSDRKSGFPRASQDVPVWIVKAA